MTNKQFAQKNKDRLYLFNSGTYYNAFEIFGAHVGTEDKQKGTRFTVWAPEVKSIAVIGDFNNWNEDAFLLMSLGQSGVWTGFIPGAKEGDAYKYLVTTKNGEKHYKADPYAFGSEVRPKSASIITKFRYKWNDDEWIKGRNAASHFDKAKNIYEVHLGSWMQHPKENKDDKSEQHFLSYKELEDTLIPYVKKMGYTHIEIMPIMEHPLDDSWGYQVTGYYSATSRFGKPDELKSLINAAHNAGIGIILDWVPAHFCRDEHGLCKWNGEKLYEKTEHKQWGTFTFDYGRPEVKSFLLSNAMFWLKEFHADGLRVDGVSSMLYLNYGVENPKEKVFNKFGEEGNLEAIEFLQDLSKMIGEYFPGCFTVAEESTAWPMVTYPPKEGLGFHYKWDMGWMHDTLDYVSTDYLFRKGNQTALSFSTMYMYSENFILPLSHDEVVHGKKSILGRQQGSYERQFEGLRLLALYQITHPGGKLNFMGNEIGEFIEWRFYESLEWFLLDYPIHKAHQKFIKKLNHIYLKEKALWDNDKNPSGFEWIDADNAEQSTIIYARHSKSKKSTIVCALNFGWNGYEKYRIGVPQKGSYKLLIDTADSKEYVVKAEKIACHGREYSIEIKLPQSGGAIFKRMK